MLQNALESLTGVLVLFGAMVIVLLWRIASRLGEIRDHLSGLRDAVRKNADGIKIP
jgi:hypothetical protein